MAFYDKFPYSNFHELNTDWIIQKIKHIDDSVQETAASAEAAAASASASDQSAQASAASAEAAAASADASEESALNAAASAAGIEAARQQIYINTARLDNLIVDGTPTEGNTELLDIRVGGNGVTYPTAGDAVRGQYDELHQAASQIDDALNTSIVKIIEYSESASSIQALNNTYVWMLTTPIPKGKRATITLYGRSYITYGSLSLYFLAKNANNTYTVKNSTTVTLNTGENRVTLPADLTQTSDIYVAFYSNSNGIGYNVNTPVGKPTVRCAYADIGDSEITMSGSFNLYFDATITYVISDLDDIEEELTRLTNTNTVVVDPSGNGDYTNIIDAMTTEPENTVIIIQPGIYDQDMTDCLKKRVILRGVDRNQCIIRDSDGRYGHHPLYVSCGYFENLTIEAPYVSGVSQEIGLSDLGAYAVHIDTDDDYGVGKQIEFYHCNIYSDFFPAIGCGLRKDLTLIIDDCILTNNQIVGRGDYSDEGSLGALYFHDSNGEQGNQYVILKDSVLKSKLKYAMCPYQVARDPQNNRVFCNFINNVLYSDVGKYTDTVWFRGDPFNAETGIFSIEIGYGNSINSINN